MRPLISWPELTKASVGLWGLGVEGTASFRRLQSMGNVPVIADDTPQTDQYEGIEVQAMDQGGLEALLSCDVVIKSPGISRYRPEVTQLEQAGIPVRGGLGLWLEEVDRAKVACITGTKGKSTTTSLAVHLISRMGHSAAAGGNIGQPPWDPSARSDPEYWVIETSSFQVPDLTTGPPVVAVTSLSPDHLDWHGDVEHYYADKLSLCTKAGVTTVVADGTDAALRARSGSLGPEPRWVGDMTDDTSRRWMQGLHLPGRHNVRNAAIARAVLVALGLEDAGDDAVMAAAAEGFEGLPSRCHSLGKVGQVEFVDDSLSTNVLPAQAALAAFADRPVALLVGGHDRGLDYTPLAESVARRSSPTLVVTLPDNGPRIGDAIRNAAGTSIEVVDAADLDHAVDRAYQWASSGGVVLLSPAAPSFGHFRDYRDRAQAFAAAAARCGPLS